MVSLRGVIFVETLDDMRVLEINAHIWTKEKHAWLELPAHIPQFEEGYDRNKVWPQESLDRLAMNCEKQPESPESAGCTGRQHDGARLGAFALSPHCPRQRTHCGNVR